MEVVNTFWVPGLGDFPVWDVVDLCRVQSSVLQVSTARSFLVYRVVGFSHWRESVYGAIACASCGRMVC